jgi:uncharacterized membrane protein
VKSVFFRGILVLIILVIIGVVVSAGIIWLISIIKPLILLIFGPDISLALEYLFCFLFIILLALILGYLIRDLPKTRLAKKYLTLANTNKVIQNKPAVLVEFSKGVYLAGIAIEDQKILTEKGEKNAKRIFLPSSPIPFTGWTVIAEVDRITPINSRYQEILTFASSWGSLGLKPLICAQKINNSSPNDTKQKNIN